MVQLLATPEKFDGKLVRVFGFLRLEFEGDALYFHREDDVQGLTRNGIWVVAPMRWSTTQIFSTAITCSSKVFLMRKITDTWAYSEGR